MEALIKLAVLCFIFTMSTAHAIMNDGKSYFVQSTDNVRIHVYEVGDPNKPSLVFLHGFPDEMRLWSKQIEDLKKDYHILAIDMRGMGKSTQPTPNVNYHYEVPDLVNDLDAVIDHAIPNKPFSIIAHDWGGAVGWYYIDKSPKKHLVQRFIPISSPNFQHLYEFVARYAVHCNFWYCTKDGKIAQKQKQSSAYIGFFLSPVAPEQFLWSGAYLDEFTQAFLGIDFFKQAMQTNGFPANDPYLYSRPNDEIFRSSTNGLRYYRANMTNPKNVTWTKRSRTNRVHLIWGESDNFLVPGTQKHTHEYFVKDCLFTQEVIKDGEHWVQRQFPERVNQIIRRVLNETPCF